MLAGRKLTPFYPVVADVTGDMISAVLVAEVMYLWEHNGNRAFSNFISKNLKHKDYRIGQSWHERLRITPGDWRTAIGKVSKRVTKESAKNAGFPDKDSYIRHLLKNGSTVSDLVILDSDPEGKTWHFFNRKLFDKLIAEAEAENQKSIEKDVSSLEEYSNEFDYEFSEYRKENPRTEADKLDEFFATPIKREPSKRKEPKQGKLSGAGSWEHMPDRYLVSKAILDSLEELGYDRVDLELSAKQFTFYYQSGDGKKKKSTNWDDRFSINWIPTNYEYGKIRKDGRYKDDKPSQEDIYRGNSTRYQNLSD